MKKKLIRITTVPMSLGGLLEGQLNYMSKHYDVLGISSSADGLINDIAKWEQIRVLPVEMTRKITPFKDLIAVYQLYQIFKKERPFIVHTHTPKAGTLGMIAAKLAGVPHRLHTIAGLPLVEATGTKRWLLNTVEKITYACASKIYPNSYGLKHIITDQKFTKATKLKVLANGSSNGINTTHYAPEHFSQIEKDNLRIQLGIKPDDFVYLFVGRLVTDKGVNELVSAFADINKQYSNTKLLLVGPYEDHMDPLSSSTMNTIKTHKNITSLGWQDDVRPYFAISNALTFPSYREGFPNVVLQAGAMKLPCIVSDINGCNEIIIDGENGFVIPVKNSNALLAAMKKMYSIPEQLKIKMGETSRALIMSKYEQNVVWNAVLAEYQSLES